MGILFNSTALGIHFCETSLIFNFKTRLGGEICLCDVNMHKGYSDGPLVPMVRLVPIENDVIPMVLLVNMHLIDGT